MPEVIFEVVVTVEAAENVGVRLDWIDKVTEEILKVRNQ